MKTFKTLQNLISFFQHKGVLKNHCEVFNLVMTSGLPAGVGCDEWTQNVLITSGHTPDSGHFWTVKAVLENGRWKAWEISA